MKAVAGMANPLLEASVVRTGTRLAFRHDGAMVDPIRRQLLFDFERLEQGRGPSVSSEPLLIKPFAESPQQGAQDLFLTAVQAEEAGEKARAMKLYQEMMELEPTFAPAWINLGTIHFHLREYDRAEQLYRRATEIDPSYVLAFFDLGNVLDELQRFSESITAYRQAVALAMPTPTTTWRWPMSAGAKRVRRCATGRFTRGWTKAAHGPITRAGRFASCSAAKSWASHGAQRASCRRAKEQLRSNWLTARARLTRAFWPISPRKAPTNDRKPNFSGDFQVPNLTMRENLGPKSFQQALIPNGLKIICKVLRGICPPWSRGGGLAQ